MDVVWIWKVWHGTKKENLCCRLVPTTDSSTTNVFQLDLTWLILGYEKSKLIIGRMNSWNTNKWGEEETDWNGHCDQKKKIGRRIELELVKYVVFSLKIFGGSTSRVTQRLSFLINCTLLFTRYCTHLVYIKQSVATIARNMARGCRMLWMTWMSKWLQQTDMNQNHLLAFIMFFCLEVHGNLQHWSAQVSHHASLLHDYFKCSLGNFRMKTEHSNVIKHLKTSKIKFL